MITQSQIKNTFYFCEKSMKIKVSFNQTIKSSWEIYDLEGGEKKVISSTKLSSDIETSIVRTFLTYGTNSE